MSWQNTLRQIKNIIYRLKRSHGLTIVLWHPTSTTHNVETGNIVRSYETHVIKRAVVLPTRLIRDFVYDLSYIAAAKNFTYGAYFDKTDRFVLIDAKDLPDGFEFTPDDYIVFQTRQYNVKEIVQAEHDAAYMLIVREISATDQRTPAYIVTGDPLSPDVAGDYYLNGQYGNYPNYERYDGRYRILVLNNTQWVIIDDPNKWDPNFFGKNDLTITGNYAGQGSWTGTATVTAA